MRNAGKILRLKLRKSRITFTALRLLLAIILFFIIAFGRESIALYLFALTSFFSFFEVFIYKKQKSQLRSILNLFADKLLVNLSAIALVMVGSLPMWVMLVFLGRDLITISGGAVLFYKDKRREFKPTYIGKITLFVQLVSLLPVMLGSLDWILIGAAIALTGVSALELAFRSEFRLVRRSDITDFFQITSLVKLADLVTLINVVFGLVAIFFVLEERYNYAAAALFLAVIFDYFDGKIARRLGQQNIFGKELDSLADTISFGVAPAIFGFSLIQTPLAIAAFTIFLFAGVLRLARYNIMHVKESFEGMPITLNGIIIPAIYLFGVPAEFYPYIYIFLGILMVSSIKFRKI